MLTLVLLASMAPAATAEGPAPGVVVNGRPVDFPVPPMLVDGYLLVPVRPVAAALGFRTHWLTDAHTVVLQRPGCTLRLAPGRPWLQVEADGRTVRRPWPVPPRQLPGTLLVPLRAVVEAGVPGARVTWDGTGRLARVELPPGGAPAPDRPAPSGPPADAPSADAGQRPIQVLSYYSEEEPPTAPYGAYASLLRHGPQMSLLAGFFSRLQVDAQGRATGYLEPMATAPYEVRRRVIDTARRQGLTVYLLVHNFLYGRPGMSADVAQQVLNDPDLRQRVIDHIRWILLHEGYDGVHLDFEGIRREDRDAYTRFVRQLRDALRPHGRQLGLSLPAKTADTPAQAWGYPYDYAALGRLADHVAVMAYDYHGYTTGPGPIAPLPWVEQVARYALATMPPERVLLGIPAHGFDWPLDGRRPRYLGARHALERAARMGLRPVVDSLGARYRYREGDVLREVWFETASHVRQKVELVRRLGLGGVAIWRMGLEDPELWGALGPVARPAVATAAR